MFFLLPNCLTLGSFIIVKKLYQLKCGIFVCKYIFTEDMHFFIAYFFGEILELCTFGSNFVLKNEIWLTLRRKDMSGLI